MTKVLEIGPRRLIYYPDDRPGILRRRCGRGFTYIAPDGTTIDDRTERRRLAALAVPPAYRDVWICPRPDGHLQATGRDARRRKQYRYHPDWTAWRAARKFGHLIEFGEALPRLRRRVAQELSGEAGDRDFALAAIIALLDRTAMRVGHPESAAENGTRGATTLTRRHVQLGDDEIRLSYRAKGGRKVRATLRDRRLHRVLHALHDLPGRDLVDWIDDEGEPHAVSSGAVNEWIAGVVGEADATAKTFRTWAGTLAAFEVALAEPKPTIRAMSEAAADRLANTPSIARTSYIHPSVIALAETPLDAASLDTAGIPSGLRKSEGQLLAHLRASAPRAPRTLTRDSTEHRAPGAVRGGETPTGDARMSEAKTTTDHDEIRRWVEERGGTPARVRGSEPGGILRIDFGAPEESLEPVSWDQFFEVFEERRLAFLHQDEADGGTSRFNKFVERD